MGILEGTGRAVGGIAAATGEAVLQTGLEPLLSRSEPLVSCSCEKLREIANDAITATDELIAQWWLLYANFQRVSLKAGVIANWWLPTNGSWKNYW